MIVYSGKRSVKSIRKGFIFEGKYTYFRQVITDFPSDKEIFFSAYIKTSDIISGTAALAIKFTDKKDEILNLVTTKEFIIGSNPWKQYYVNSIIPSGTQKIYVYCLHDGDGSCWFDNTAVFFE